MTLPYNEMEMEMTLVRELIERLQQCDQEAPVMFTVQDGNDDQIYVHDFGFNEDDGCVTIWGEE